MQGIYNLELLVEKIEAEHGLLLYFSNDRCSVCKVLKPRVAAMMQSHFPRMASYYVDIDKSPVISGQYRVFTIPTLLIFFQGKEHGRFSRSIGLSQLKEAIQKPYLLIFGQ
jgi:thioredoxin-like negative regulator of GroEL